MADDDESFETEQCRELIPHRKLAATEYERCVQTASTWGGPKLSGWDQSGNPVYLQKWMCARGHWYNTEVAGP